MEHATKGLGPVALSSGSWPGRKRPNGAGSSTMSKPSQRAIWEVWARMTAIYGHRWTSAYGEQPWPTDPRTGEVCGEGAGSTWRDGLAGVTDEEVRQGLSRCLNREGGWPPALPEFLALCGPQPADYGVPDEADAFEEAAARANTCAHQTEWSHPTILAAFRKMGRDRFKLPHREARQAWGRIWPQVVADYMAGKLTEADTALPSPAKSQAPRKGSEEAAQEGTDAMRRALGLPPKYREPSQ